MTTPDLAQRITDYLSGGGLFNPELANHDAVRDLLIECRDDAKRLDYLQQRQATISLTPDGRDDQGPRFAFMVGGWHCSVNRDVRESIDAAIAASAA